MEEIKSMIICFATPAPSGTDGQVPLRGPAPAPLGQFRLCRVKEIRKEIALEAVLQNVCQYSHRTAVEKRSQDRLASTIIV